MTSLDTVRGDLALVILYLNKAEARDKICRAIQYGSKFLSNGEPGPAQNVDKSTSLARKVFRLFKVYYCLIVCLVQIGNWRGSNFYLRTIYESVCYLLQFVNDLHALISPAAKGMPLPLILLGKVCWLLKVALHCSFRNSFSWGWLVLFWSFLIDFLHVFRSRRMQCCQLSSSWIRLCGLGGQEYTRFEDFLLYCHTREVRFTRVFPYLLYSKKQRK